MPLPLQNMLQRHFQTLFPSQMTCLGLAYSGACEYCYIASALSALLEACLSNFKCRGISLSFAALHYLVSYPKLLGVIFDLCSYAASHDLSTERQIPLSHFLTSTANLSACRMPHYIQCCQSLDFLVWFAWKLGGRIGSIRGRSMEHTFTKKTTHCSTMPSP